MDCPKCSVTNITSASYCINCGTQLSNDAVVPTLPLLNRIEAWAALMWVGWVAVGATVFGVVADLLQHPRSIVAILVDPEQSQSVGVAAVVIAGISSVW